MNDDFYKPEVREGFRIAEMTKRYWALQMNTLEVFDKICKTYDIKWFADFGTLLGAIRHHGFIPWDDDIDISMLRDDYDRFIAIAAAELPPSYQILDTGINPGYHDQIGRIVNNKRIQFDTEYLAANCGCPYTAGIDIFIMDNLYEDPDIEKDRCDRAMRVRKVCDKLAEGKADLSKNKYQIHQIETEYGIGLKGDLEIILHKLALLIRDIYKECPNDGSSRVAYMNAWTSWRGHSHDRKCFEAMDVVPFEYVTMSVPVWYDDVLKEEFGDYMKIVRGSGIDHPYPVYIVQQKILLDHLSDYPNERLKAYIQNTTDKHSEHDVQSEQILNMCDQVIAMIQTKAAGDEASCKALLQGMLRLFDSLAGMLSEDYTTEATAIKRIGYIKEMIEGYIEDDIPDADRTDRGNHMTGEEASRGSTDYNECASKLSAGLSRLRDEITELYRGHGPIATGEPVDA